MEGNILIIDPGKYRSGIAVLDHNKNVIDRKVVKTIVLMDELTSLYYSHDIYIILIGNGGPGRVIEKKIAGSNIKASVLFVNEKGSTLEARWLYWEDNKPKGIMRLIPKTLRIPPVPYDDYAAIVIGKRYLNGECR